MHIVIAMDSFKGSLTSREAGDAVAAGVMRVLRDAETTVSPLADGGEGSSAVILNARGGTRRHLTVTGPLGERVEACYGILSDGNTAVMEMAAAAGLPLVPEGARNPMVTTTYGVGEMIQDAIEQGVRHFIVGIGGSATNDGGVGMLSALGYTFTDTEGIPVPPGAAGLARICRIDTAHAHPALPSCTFRIACDVENPLCGMTGCSAVFGPQKGADPAMVEEMDAAMAHYARMTAGMLPHADATAPGSGAAGGLGYAFAAYLGGTLVSGIELIISETGLEEQIRRADMVITGEGRLDGQSQMGKTPVGVARIAKKYGKPVFALAGSVTEDAHTCHDHGIDAYLPIVKAPCTLSEAMNPATARQNLTDTAEQLARIIRSVR